jgi:hypothetical protein
MKKCCHSRCQNIVSPLIRGLTRENKNVNLKKEVLVEFTYKSLVIASKIFSFIWVECLIKIGRSMPGFNPRVLSTQ